MKALKKSLLATFLICIITLFCVGCTQQSMTREYGGSMEITLPPNEKLEVITWKDDELWYLTRPMRENEEAEIHIYQESSSWGIMEGTVTIIEVKE